MALPWNEVVAKPEYQSLSLPDQLRVRDDYFRDVVMPKLPKESIASTYEEFATYADSLNAPEPEAVKPESEKGDVSRGFGTAFKQIPQLGYGLLAGAGAVAENLSGDGGIATAIKNKGVEGYNEWGAKIQADSKETDSLTHSWNKAKEGDFGALVDWMQYGLGYAGGQAVQMLVTGGVGSLVGKATLGTVAKSVAEGMVAKEAARLSAGGAITEAITKNAVANVAAKIGQTTAIGAQAFGMEGGEIFGDVVSKEAGVVSGDKLAKAFGATIAAGGLEFVGDKIGLDLMLGKGVGKMSGISGRGARAAAGGAAGVLTEGGTEFGQTLIEEAGKGNDAFSEESITGAIDAAGLGAVGGAAMGGVGGGLSKPKPEANPEQPAQTQITPEQASAANDHVTKVGIENIAASANSDDIINSAAELLDEKVIAPTRQFGMLSQGETGFGRIDEFANLIASEKADLNSRMAKLQQTQAQQRESNLESVDARVLGARDAETRMSRLSALDEVYANPQERTPGMTFLAHLEAQHPNNPNPTAEEKAIIAKRDSAYQAFSEKQLSEPSLPNESPDMVKEKELPLANQAQPNDIQRAKVDEAIASGLKLNGSKTSFINKAGKNKLILNSAQRAYVRELLAQNKQPQEQANGASDVPASTVVDSQSQEGASVDASGSESNVVLQYDAMDAAGSGNGMPSESVEVNGKGAVVSDKGSDAVIKWLDNASKKLEQESWGQDVLDTMQESNESPQSVAETFWNSTYQAMPEQGQKLFRKLYKKNTGQSLQDGDNPLDMIDLGDTAENLQGTERGFVALMREANNQFGSARLDQGNVVDANSSAKKLPSPVEIKDIAKPVDTRLTPVLQRVDEQAEVAPVIAQTTTKSITRTNTGKLNFIGFTDQEVSAAIKSIGLSADVRPIDTKGQILVSELHKNGVDKLPMNAKRELALRAALTGEVPSKVVRRTPDEVRASKLSEKSTKEHNSMMRKLADEYGIEAKPGVSMKDVERDVKAAIEAELAVWEKNYAMVRAEAIASGVPESELQSIQDEVEAKYTDDSAEDAHVRELIDLTDKIEEVTNEYTDKQEQDTQGQDEQVTRIERDLPTGKTEEASAGKDARKTVNDVAPQSAEIQAAQSANVKQKKAKRAKTVTLLTTIRDMGGLKHDSKTDVAGDKFAPGGYNQVFKKNSRSTIEGLVGKGELDEYLPYELRFATNDRAGGEVADMQEAAEWIKDKIRSGEKVIPYDAQIELEQKAIEAEYDEQLINAIAEELNHDEINAEIQIAANKEREGYLNAKVFVSDDEIGSSERGNGVEEGTRTKANASEQAPVLELTGQTEQELKSEQAAQEAAQRAEDTKVKAEQVKNDQAAVDAKIKARADNPDNFIFGEDSKAAAKPESDLFAQNYAPETKREAKPEAKLKEPESDNPSKEIAQSEIDKTGGILFSKSQGGGAPSLIIQHNLSETNLLHAERMGGIPIPSLAITQADHPLTGFGEITLVGGVNMADPKGYAATKVFGADIYSPRYPSINHQFTSNMKQTAEGRLKDAIAATNTRLPWDDMENGSRELERSAPMMWQFLKDKGIQPIIKYRETKPLDKVLQPFADKLASRDVDYFDMQKDPAFIDAAYQTFKDKLIAANGEEYRSGADAEIAEMRNRAKETGKDYFVSGTAKEVNQYIMNRASEGDIDKQKTGYSLEGQISAAGLNGEMERYAKEFFDDIGSNERIFQGYTNSGSRKYIPHTIDNVIKLLKKDLRGGESFNYGVGTIRSKMTPQFKSIKQIQDAKNRLMDNASFEKVKDDINKELFALSEEFSAYHPIGGKIGFGDTMSSTLYDAATMGLQRAFRENGFNDVPPEKLTLAAEFLEKLRSLPTEYFEAKILRAVDLSEFKGAVVPEDISQKALDILKKRGINNILKYKGESDRAAKIKQLATDAELMFSKSQSTVSNPFTTSTLEDRLIDSHQGAERKAVQAMLDAGTMKVITREEAAGIVGGDALYAKLTNQLTPLRTWITQVRGGWTKDKIRKELKNPPGGSSGKLIHREIAKFDNANELADNIFYHGTGGSVKNGLKASITQSQREADNSGGGGYGERYWAVSISKSKNIASNFTGQSSSGTVYPVILKKGANVISMPEIQDSVELEDHIVDLWNRGIDAVRIGDWTKESSEQEVAILNPKAIFKYDESESYAVYKKKRFEQLTDGQIEQIYQDSVKIIPHLDAIKNLPREDRDAALRDIPRLKFSKEGNAQAFYNPADGVSYFIADAISSDISDKDLRGLVLHEVAVHAKQLGTDSKEWKSILDQVELMRKAKNKKVLEAFARVPTDTPTGDVTNEAIAYLVQHSNDMPIIKRVIAWMRNAIRAIGKKMPVVQRSRMFDWAASLNEDDLLFMAKSALVSGGVSASRQGGAVMASKTQFDGDGRKQIDTTEFKKWFGDSKVIDADGNPLVVYHGTDSDITEFDPKLTKNIDGIFMTPEVFYANQIARAHADGANVMPLYASLKNPHIIDISKGDYYNNYSLEKAMSSHKNDGVIVMGEDGNIHVVIAKESTQIKSAIGNSGAFSSDTGNILFSRQQQLSGMDAQSIVSPTIQQPIGLTGGQNGSNASWDSPDPSMFDDIVYKLQDKNIDLKRVIEEIKATGAKIADKYNAYLNEELFHGRAAKRTQDFLNTELKPLLEEMRMRGLTDVELEEFLHARHAKEANALIAQRDPNMQDGGSGMTNKEADDHMNSLPADKRGRLESMAKRVDAIIAKTRESYVADGLVSRNQADEWADMFKHYVPLMREDHDGGMGIGQGFSIKGKEVKYRTGSTAKVVDILANIALQREKEITRAEKNRVAISLAGLAKLNPNPDFWTFDKIPTERVLNEKTGLVETRIDPMFKSKANVIVAKIKDNAGEIQERAIVFNERNERAMRMSESLKNLDATQLGGLLGVSAKITRYFAAINTQYNPVFGLTNITRDVQGMLLNLSSTPIAMHKTEVLKHIAPAIIGIYADARSERKGKPATSRYAQDWEEMQDEGGMTGYRDLYRTSNDRADAIRKELDPYAWHNNTIGKIFTAGGLLKVPLKIAQDKAGWIFDLLSDYNQTLEGATRLAVYKVARDNGISKPQAASIAKNVTVNFNRKGQSGQQAGALYAFFNAAMQGTARIGETVFDMEKGDIKTLRMSKAGKNIIYGGIMLGSMQAIMLAASGFGDDEPPEFIRERNLIIPTIGGDYISIPMPLGFHVLPNLGRIPTEWAMNGFKESTKHVIDLISIFADSFNPIGNAGMSLQTIAPTALDPLAALAENKDWTGKNIARPDYNSLKPTPGFTRGKDTATTLSMMIAEGVNFITGGDDYKPGAISPTADQLDYLGGQIGGGVWREASKIEQALVSSTTGEEMPMYKVPVLGKFYGTTTGQASQGAKYYDNLKRIYEVDSGIKGRREDGLPVDEYMADNQEYRLLGRAKYAEKIIKSLKKQKKNLLESGAEREKVKEIEDRITAEMKRLNDAADKLES